MLRRDERLTVTDVHPIMLLLISNLIFPYSPGKLALIRRRPHQVSGHLTVLATDEFSFIACSEPIYTGPVSSNGYEKKIPDAARAAWAKIPSAVVYKMQARA